MDEQQHGENDVTHEQLPLIAQPKILSKSAQMTIPYALASGSCPTSMQIPSMGRNVYLKSAQGLRGDPRVHPRVASFCEREVKMLQHKHLVLGKSVGHIVIDVLRRSASDPCCSDPSHGNGEECDVDLSARFLSNQNAMHWLHECHKQHPARREPKRREEALAIRASQQDELTSQQIDRRPLHQKGKLIHVGPEMAR